MEYWAGSGRGRFAVQWGLGRGGKERRWGGGFQYFLNLTCSGGKEKSMHAPYRTSQRQSNVFGFLDIWIYGTYGFFLFYKVIVQPNKSLNSFKNIYCSFSIWAVIWTGWAILALHKIICSIFWMWREQPFSVWTIQSPQDLYLLPAWQQINLRKMTCINAVKWHW